MNSTLEAELYKRVKIEPTQPSVCKDFIGRYFGMGDCHNCIFYHNTCSRKIKIYPKISDKQYLDMINEETNLIPQGDINIQNLTFKYSRTTEVLKNININIK